MYWKTFVECTVLYIYQLPRTTPHLEDNDDESCGRQAETVTAESLVESPKEAKEEEHEMLDQQSSSRPLAALKLLTPEVSACYVNAYVQGHTVCM